MGGLAWGKWSLWRVLLHVCVCMSKMPVSEVPVVFGVITSTAPSLSLTLYSDCLQARRHFPVKVSLMNSNDPTECLRQVIHNHSSFSFPLNSLTIPRPPHLYFLPPSLPLFLSLKKTTFPRTAHNQLSVFIYFILVFFFYMFSFFMRIDAVCCNDEVMPRMSFLGIS